MSLPGRIAPVAVGVVAAAACVVVVLVDPNDPGRYPLCPFRWVTGLDCPGCGTLRAVHALGHGEVTTALDHNVLTIALMPVLVVAWVVWLVRGRPALPTPSFGYATAGLLAAFWVVRNLPWEPFVVLGSGA